VACERCEANPARERGPRKYLGLLWHLRTLLRGGMRLSNDTLTLRLWADLGVLEDVVESMRPRLI